MMPTPLSSVVPRLDVLIERVLAQRIPVLGEQIAVIAAVQEAPVVPDYYSQIAAHAVSNSARYDKTYRDALKSAFVRHGVLSLDI